MLFNSFRFSMSSFLASELSTNVSLSDSKSKYRGHLRGLYFCSGLVEQELLEAWKFLKTDDPPVPSTKNSPKKRKIFFLTANCPANFLFGVTSTHGTEVRT